MANAVVTSGTNSVKVAFNDLASATGMLKGIWRKESIHFALLNDFSVVRVIAYGEQSFFVSHNGANSSLTIDSVDGAAPSSLSDLYDKLAALIA